MPTIQELINQFGEKKARLYLQERYSHLEHFWEFASIFSHHLGDAVPDFHDEIVTTITPVGHYAVVAPRGGAKSTIIGLVWLAWLALNGYKRFVPYISDTFLQAKLIAGGLRAEIESNTRLRWLYPNCVGDRWGEEGFVINGLKGECFILPIGAGMKVRGLKYKNYRPDLMLLDDIENLENVYSAEQREKLKRWFDYDIEPAMDRYSKHIVIIGTILHFNSLLNQVIKGEGRYSGWKKLFYKALSGNNLSFWPARFSSEYLLQIRDDPNHPDFVGSVVFAQEMQNEPQDDKDRIIKLEWQKEYSLREVLRGVEGADDDDRLKKWLKPFEIVGGVDPAISEKQTADNFSFYTYALDKQTGKEYQLDLVHGKFSDINKQVQIICDGVEQWGHDEIGIESVAYQKGLAQLVKTELQRRGIYACRIIEIKTDKDKIRRARIHSSAFEAGYILLRNDHENFSIIKREISEFPLGAHDDSFDSLMLAREARQKPVARTFAKKAF